MSGRRPKHVRLILMQAERIVAAHGLTLACEAHGGNHRKLVIEGRGQRRVTPLSSTPTDCGNAVRFKLLDVKRIVREMCA